MTDTKEWRIAKKHYRQHPVVVSTGEFLFSAMCDVMQDSEPLIDIYFRKCLSKKRALEKREEELSEENIDKQAARAQKRLKMAEEEYQKQRIRNKEISKMWDNWEINNFEK